MGNTHEPDSLGGIDDVPFELELEKQNPEIQVGTYFVIGGALYQVKYTYFFDEGIIDGHLILSGQGKFPTHLVNGIRFTADEVSRNRVGKNEALGMLLSAFSQLTKGTEQEIGNILDFPKKRNDLYNTYEIRRSEWIGVDDMGGRIPDTIDIFSNPLRERNDIDTSGYLDKRYINFFHRDSLEIIPKLNREIYKIIPKIPSPDSQKN